MSAPRSHPLTHALLAFSAILLQGVWIIAIGVAGAILLQLGWVQLKNGQPDFSTLQLALLTWIQFLGMASIVGVLTALSRTPWRDTFRVQNPGIFGWMAGGICGLTVWMFPSKVAEWVLQVFPQLNWGALDQIAISLMNGATNERLAFALAVVIGAPFAEEFFFRGFLFSHLERLFPHSPRVGGAIAWTVTSVLFALFHLDPAQALPVFFTGLFLGALRWASGSVIPAIVAHFANNALAAISVLTLAPTESTEGLPWAAAGVGVVISVAAVFLALRSTTTAPVDAAAEPPHPDETPTP